MSKFIALNQFLPTNALGKTFPRKKIHRCLRRHLWMSLIGKQKGDCLLKCSANDLELGGFRVACNQKSLHKNVLLDGIFL